jgi:hypothetical protein
MRQTQRRQPESPQQPTFERTPWVAREVIVEEPRRAQDEAPLQLAGDENVVDAMLDGEAIRRQR